MPEYASPEGALIPVECYGDTFVPAIRSIVRQPTDDDDELRCTPRMPAIRFCCPADVIGDADVTGDADNLANDAEVPLPVPMGDPCEVPGTMNGPRVGAES